MRGKVRKSKQLTMYALDDIFPLGSLPLSSPPLLFLQHKPFLETATLMNMNDLLHKNLTETIKF